MSTALATLLLLVTATPMVRVGPGEANVLDASKRAPPRSVAAFELDRTAVTNAQFLAFVKANPRWRRDRTPRLFADDGYLALWSGPLTLSARARPRAPVVRVSWFAARAYCAWRDARLPTEDEWELAAAADATRPDARADHEFAAQLLAWYGRPTPPILPDVGRGPPNLWGAQELHGLIWEWVLDFGSTPAAAEAASCGGGTDAQGNTLDYAGFMRSAFRSALEAAYTTDNLGFRCARSRKERR